MTGCHPTSSHCAPVPVQSEVQVVQRFKPRARTARVPHTSTCYCPSDINLSDLWNKRRYNGSDSAECACSQETRDFCLRKNIQGIWHEMNGIMGDTPLNPHSSNGDRCRRLFCRMPRTIRNVLIILSLMVFAIWELRRGQTTWDQVSGAAVAMIQPHPSASAIRIAMVTFITAEHSYLYLALKNKARMCRPEP